MRWKKEFGGMKSDEAKRLCELELESRRLGTVEGGITRRQTERPNHVWLIDFIFDRTENGRRLKILSLVRLPKQRSSSDAT